MPAERDTFICLVISSNGQLPSWGDRKYAPRPEMTELSKLFSFQSSAKG